MIIAWLALTLSLAVVTAFAAWSRRDTHHRTMAVLALLVAVPVAFYALRVPLGLPDASVPPPAEYALHGARIDQDVAIYILVSKDGGEPHYYRLPYSTQTANELQQALDGSQNGDLATMEMRNGQPVFEAPPVAPDPPKES